MNILVSPPPLVAAAAFENRDTVVFEHDARLYEEIIKVVPNPGAVYQRFLGASDCDTCGVPKICLSTFCLGRGILGVQSITIFGSDPALEDAQDRLDGIRKGSGKIRVGQYILMNKQEALC